MTVLTVTATVVDAGGHSASATVTASLSPATERAWRESLDYETGVLADGSNTGLYTDPRWAAIPRTVVTNHVPVAGQDYFNLDIQNEVIPPAGTGVARYWNCDFQGAASGSGHCIRLFNAGHITVELYDSRIKPRAPRWQCNGATGYGYKLVRTEITETSDGFDVFNSANPDGPTGVELRGVYIHDLFWASQAAIGSGPADGVHSDCGQIQGGSGTVIRGCNLQGFIRPVDAPNFYGTNHANATLMIKTDVGLITGLDCQFNRIDGGAYSVNCASDGTVRVLGTFGTVSNNQFGHGQRGGRTISMPVSAGGTTTTGNTYYDTGAAVTVYRQG